MPIHRSAFEKAFPSDAERAEIATVASVVDQLVAKLTQQDVDINRAHVVGAQSSVIQAIVGATLRDIGFGEEVVLTPQDGLVTRSRPDFVLPLEPGRGVMAEVERGGTVNNNHDLKDMWKAHIAVDIQHLVLVVPNLNWKTDGGGRERPYPRVCSRVGAFFGDPRREVDVLSAHVIGYGLMSPPSIDLGREDGVKVVLEDAPSDE